ncbi:hypothetical protein CEP54_014977 [Fusarium duplospermum]|uniref:Cyclin N-terminal domain-containing protein n=1 Tax=Fusarium duplospermum TaxID=1325734 RepID=A0A428NSF9_9HYPO|nr:hypothetical protein CEP54_014977 [Fusarium duplospermum]
MNYSEVGSDELNAIALRELARQPINQDMIAYVSSFAAMITQCGPSHTVLRENISSTIRKAPDDSSSLMSLENFVSVLIQASGTQVTTLMGALVYLVRLQAKLQPGIKGHHTTNHRIFLASLILAAKYLEDNALMNKHWAHISSGGARGQETSFSLREINLMEIQLLDLLGWELCITLEDLFIVSEPFLAPIRVAIQRFRARDFLYRSTPL